MLERPGRTQIRSENFTAKRPGISGRQPTLCSRAANQHPPGILQRLPKFKCGDAYDIHQKLLIQNSIMINAIMRYKDVDSLSSQERNALEVIRKLVSITDEGMLDINKYNKDTKSTKDQDDYACKVSRKILEESKPILEGLKTKG